MQSLRCHGKWRLAVSCKFQVARTVRFTEAARGLGVLVEVGFSLIPVNQGVWGGPQLPEAPTGGETGRLQLGSKTKLT